MHRADDKLEAHGDRKWQIAARFRRAVVSPKFVAFVLLTFGMGWFVLEEPGQKFFYDSGAYWWIGSRFLTSDGWSFSAYSNPLRPYFFPMVLSGVQGLAGRAGWDPIVLFRLFSAANFGILCGVLAPAFVERLWGGRVSLVRILGFGGLVALFWRGHFLYPLTDFPAVTLWGFAVYCVLPQRPGARQAWWWFVLAGFALAAAFYSRPAYQAGLILLVFVGMRRVFVGSGLGWRTPARLGLMCLGIGVLALPQMSVNERLSNSRSIFVTSEGLFLLQLRWGLILNRYETNVGEGLPFPDVGFIDREGIEVLHTAGVNRLGEISSYGEYFSMALDQPARFLSIYTRRVFSGMDVWFSDVYIHGPIERSVGLGLITYTLWFGFGWVLWRTITMGWPATPGDSGKEACRRGRLFDVVGPLVVFCAPVGLAVPSAVEPRFFLPAHLVVYGVVCFGLPSGWWRGLVSRRALPLWCVFAVFVLACNMVSSWMFASLQQSAGAHKTLSGLLEQAPAR